MSSHLIYISAELGPLLVNLANKNGQTPAEYLGTVCKDFLADKMRAERGT